MDTITKTTTKITINGQEYSNIEDVPSEYRQLLEDKNGNGIPDKFDEMLQNNQAKKTEVKYSVTNTKTSIGTPNIFGKIRDFIRKQLGLPNDTL